MLRDAGPRLGKTALVTPGIGTVTVRTGQSFLGLRKGLHQALSAEDSRRNKYDMKVFRQLFSACAVNVSRRSKRMRWCLLPIKLLFKETFEGKEMGEIDHCCVISLLPK